MGIATRLDAFSDVPTSKFGEMGRNQMEERLEFYSSGTAPRKNKDVMGEVIAELRAEGLYAKSNIPGESDDAAPRKRARDDSDSDDEDDAPVAKKQKSKDKSKDKSKSKKEKSKDKKKSKKKSKSKK